MTHPSHSERHRDDDEGMGVAPEPGLPIWLVLVAAAIIVAAFGLAVLAS